MSKYTLPGMPDWSFDEPTLSHRGGAGFKITGNTTPEELKEAIKRILRGTTLTPDEAVFEKTAQASTNINWLAMLDPYRVLVAPLLNPVTTAQAIPPEQLDKIYKDLETAYYAIKRFDPRA